MEAPLIGIRREDKNAWERRVALTPEAVRHLIEVDGLRVRVQPSPRRIFPDEAYVSVGAELDEDLDPCRVVFAVKEVPIERFAEGQAYMFFSHTIKGQAYNMPMLARMRERRCSLLDYERVVDEQNRRLIFFGWYAGVAGMIDTLCMVDERLRALGHDSPFRGVKPAWKYTDMAELEAAVREIGERIHRKGLPAWLSPFVCGFLGYGHVSRGAQHIWDLMPTVEIRPSELSNLDPNRRNVLYKVVYHESDLVEPRDPSKRFDLQEYYQHPGRYQSRFHEQLPYLRLVINGIYWTEAYPRFVTKAALKKLFSGRITPRLLGIGDISCDIGGSIECTTHATHSDAPFFVYDPLEDATIPGVEGFGVSVMAVDNLPCELPAEASRTFSSVLTPFVPAIARADYGAAYEEILLPPPIRTSLLLLGGELTPPYRYLESFLAR
jgi:alpha-aminoadipic semialdehyde synthase